MPDLLTIDIGNSTACCRRADGAVWSTTSSAPDVDGLLAFVLAPGAPASRCVAVSVVPDAARQIEAGLRDRGVAVEFAGRDLLCPLPLRYRTPETLGADRWVGALAAHRRCLAAGGPGAVLTVDCGTATTVNAVAMDGAFCGGAIAPGLAAFVTGMRRTAPALPSADLDAHPVMPGATTQASVDAGVLVGFAGMVQALVRELRAVVAEGTNEASVPVVLTGGQARRLLGLLPDEHGYEHVPELLHDGLAALLNGEAV